MMKTFTKNLLLLVALTCGVLTSSADVPTGYYNSLNNKKDQALKDAVYQRVRPHTALSYNSLWSYFPSTDAWPTNPSRVWDMYSNDDFYYPGNGKSVSGMNREHSFPKSWWGGSTNKDLYPSYTDLNHLYPSEAKANTAKSAWPLGIVSGEPTFSNGACKVGIPVAGQGGGASKVFEPGDEYKGDFARTYFYMATCYQDYNWSVTYMVNNNSNNWKTLNEWSINLLLDWARNDPVSDKEKKRNEEVYKAQNNRNPFIDHPDLMEYIWGNKQGEVFNVSGSTPGPQTDPELITPTQGTQIDFGEVAIGKSIDYVVYVKANNLTSNLSVQIYRYDAQMFKTNVSSIDRNVANSEQGYPLTITYTPTSVGDHKTKLLISDGGLIGSYGAEITAHCREIPTLTAVKALPPIDLNISEGSYTACWEPTEDEIDNYILNRTVYDASHNIVGTDAIIIDSGEVAYEFDDLEPGQTHTYNVQSYRLGYTSVESNVITVSSTGITGIEAPKPFGIISAQGGVVVKCDQPLGTARIYNTSGQLVMEIPEVNNDDFIELPMGIYIMTTESGKVKAKLVVK